MNPQKFALTIVATLVLFGCRSTKEVIYDNGSRAPTEQVAFFREGKLPDRKYREIGEVQVETFGGEESEATKKLIKRAKALGADLIIMLPRKETGFHFNPVGRSGDRFLYKAVAAVYE